VSGKLLSRFDLTPAAGLCPRGGIMSFARGEAGCRRHLDGAGTVTTKARRRERIAQDPEYRARERARRRAYEEANKEELGARRQFRYLQRRYGISRADYDALLTSQGGVCPLCGKPSKKTLCVDHCHATGTIRGLLCRQCNFALGCLADDQAAMIAALAYLGCGCRDRAGAAAKRALAARAVLPPGRAGMTVRVEARSPNHLCADVAPAGDSAMRPIWNALDAQLRREDDDGEGGKASILQLIARKLAAKALAGDLEAIKEIFDRMDGKPVVAADAPPGRSCSNGTLGETRTEKSCRDEQCFQPAALKPPMLRPLARTFRSRPSAARSTALSRPA
jgi:Autographiviridae endonuclease VII